jgi:lysozyme
VVLDPHGKQIKGAENKQLAHAVYPKGLSRAEAEVLLADDIRRFAAGVERLLQVQCSDARFCALLSFAYNLGVGALARSTLLRVINEGNSQKAPEQFLRWTKAGGKELAGLKRRREAEVKLWQAESL